MASIHTMEKEIKVDEASDTDENYETGEESTTTSLASSVFEYQYENGRRYHAFNTGKYVLPNDEVEQDRLDMFHHVFCILLGGRLHLAPLDNPQRILDIGTGTGIWALDIAAEFPSAEVIGIDLSPIQPRWVLPNTQFIVEDAEYEWVYSKNTFDYIHMRCMVGSIQNWENLLKQVFDCLRPGGYVELAEFQSFNLTSDDNSYSNKSSLWKYYDLVNKASKKRGYPLTLETSLIELLSQRGFEGIECTPAKLAMGTWPADKKHKELGRWMQLIAQSGFEAYGLALLTRELGMETSEIQTLFDEAKKDLSNKKIHAYGVVDHIFARKPLDEPSEKK